MTEEQAREILLREIDKYWGSSKYRNALTIDLEKAITMGVNALDKMIPKKPIKAQEHIRYAMCYVCPNCGKTFSGTGIANYCYHCGQKLDWSECE